MTQKIKKKISCLKPTSDDWCPNFAGNQLAGNVQVSFINYGKSKSHENRVVVSGDDDMMMEYEGIDAKQKYEQIIALTDVTQKATKSIGLVFG